MKIKVEQYERQIEGLKTQILRKVRSNDEDRARMRELEEAVLVCKEQLNSFD